MRSPRQENNYFGVWFLGDLCVNADTWRHFKSRRFCTVLVRSTKQGSAGQESSEYGHVLLLRSDESVAY